MFKKLSTYIFKYIGGLNIHVIITLLTNISMVTFLYIGMTTEAQKH